MARRRPIRWVGAIAFGFFLIPTFLPGFASGVPVSVESTGEFKRAIASVPADQSANRPPLKILRIKSTPNRDSLQEVEVRNVSDKVIVRYRLGWHIRNAIPASYGFEGGDESYAFTVGNAVQTRLQPGARDVAPPQGALPMEIDPMLDEKSASKHVFILVGIADVTFEDGTRWSGNPKDFKRIAKPSASS